MRTRRILPSVVVLLIFSGLASAADENTTSPSPAATAIQGDEPATPEEYWKQTKADVFEDIELTPAQASAVDKMIAEAAAARASYADTQARLDTARKEGNAKVAGELSEQLIQLRDTFRPTARLLEMRELLSDEQREVFNRNMRLRDDRKLAKRWAKREAARQKAEDAQKLAPDGRRE